MKKKYISKGEYFKKDVECELVSELIDDCMGIFKGVRVCPFEEEAKCHNVKIGDEYIDEELCGLDEFEVIECEDE